MSSFNQNVIKNKTGLLNLAAELGNISKACRMMGFSRDTFYRYRQRVTLVDWKPFLRSAGGNQISKTGSMSRQNLLFLSLP